MTDDTRPSIAELQRIEREDLSPAPWESLDHWTPADRGKVAIRNAAPVLLEIVAAALAARDAACTCSSSDGGHYAGCATLAADAALDAALAKVRQ